MKPERYAPSLEGRLGQDVWTVPAMLQARAGLSHNAAALWEKETPDGAWKPTTWGEYRDSVARIVAGLKHLGLAPGERVGIMAPSSRRWDLVQMGVLAAQGVVVGLDPHDLDENLNSIAERCNLAGVVVQDPSWFARLGANVRDRLRFAVYLDSSGKCDQGIEYDDLLQLTDVQPDHTWDTLLPDDPATIVFTSGTTGAPKGIQYSHRQLCLAVASILEAFPDVDDGSHLACWLPLSNMFQRIINLFAIGCGAQTYYVEDPRTIMTHISSIDPHLFIGVPRFYEKLYAGMTEKISQGPAWQQALVGWAFHVGESYAGTIRCGKRLNILRRLYHGLADYLVLQRLRSVMGTNLRYMVSGSAAMPVWLLERFHAMGLLVLEAYGMSENAIPIAINRLDAYRFGTVGCLMSGCDVRLADDGELLVRGPGVTSSYYNEEQAELLDDDGYLASGDYATIDADGFITLVGRKSEIIKTATGRRIAPAGIESILSKVPFVESAAVFGAGRPFLVAIVTVSAEASSLIAYCERVRPEFVQYLASLPGYKCPAGLVVTTRLFTPEGGELTANLKLRRRNIAEQYADELNAIYQQIERAKGGIVLEAMDAEKGDIVLCSL